MVSLDKYSKVFSTVFFFQYSTEQATINRVHIILSIHVVYLLSFFTTNLINVKVQKHSFDTFNDLNTRFHESFDCSCTQISLKSQSFTSIQPRVHALCFSDFITDRWIQHLFGNGSLAERFFHTDFYRSAPIQFQLLSFLCQRFSGSIQCKPFCQCTITITRCICSTY